MEVDGGRAGECGVLCVIAYQPDPRESLPLKTPLCVYIDSLPPPLKRGGGTGLFPQLEGFFLNLILFIYYQKWENKIKTDLKKYNNTPFFPAAPLSRIRVRPAAYNHRY